MRSFACHTLLLAYVAGARSETFDYVIAGAGTAGLVIANRLSDRPDISVAVIEPGDDQRNNPNVTTINWSFASLDRSLTWQYDSVPQPNLGGKSLSYFAGKAIGGSSSINGMVYIRGDKALYDAWEEELGNPGWNWDSVFASAKRGETFTPPTTAQAASGATYDRRAHGYSGPVTVGFPFVLSNSSFYGLARRTWEALGIEPTTDINDGYCHGFVSAPMTVDRDANVREDSARAYYRPVETRRNLKIIKGTVKRITWANSRGKEAVADGFEYVNPAGKLVKIRARKEVILSASAYRSPLILESSGVGNPRILKKLGIKTKVNLPGVGESMQDHNGISMMYALNSNIEGRIPFATMPTAYDVWGNETSAIAASARAKLAEWAKVVSASTQGALSPAAIEKRFRVQHSLIFERNATIAELFPTSVGTQILAQFWTSMPFSWGSIHLGAAGKIDEPVIDPGLLTIDFDRDMVTSVGRLSQKAYSTAPLTELVATNISPGYDVLPLDASDDQWADFVTGNVQNAIHVVGTCAMLPRELGGVVDARVKVHGTRNVRVVDASIIPMQMTGHTMAPVYAVAERAAELIKEDLE
ncbi:Glucose oxidase [Madurella mycetomatis]|uniref:Glucose oxidase n=1 Tax=Madurella mycetomatis TaxID=100816 RepID=A0A175VNF2_9PEZI|nr:Glucose oxidase [Madurella mycetomatis]